MKSIFTCILVSSLKFSFAASVPFISLKDTTIKKEYEMNNKQFLERYGRDDSSRALINFYFHKRNIQTSVVFAGLCLAITGAIVYIPANCELKSYENCDNSFFPDLTTVLLILLSASTAITSVPFIISGSSALITFSRKKLLKILDNYNSGKSIPHSIVVNRIFKGYLKYGAWNASIKRQLKSEERINKKMKRKHLMEERHNKLSSTNNNVAIQ